MKRLIYSSRAAAGIDSAEVFKIIEASARNNPRREITGFLLHDADRFLQYVEGPSLAIEALMADLERDPRHSHIETIHEETADKRWFADWGMKRLVSFKEAPAMIELEKTFGSQRGGGKFLSAINTFLAN